MACVPAIPHGLAVRLAGLALSAFCFAGPAAGETLYEAPAGCEVAATLRLPSCVVRHVSICAGGNIADSYRDAVFVGRAHYAHPSLFVRWQGADGRAVGHDYGAGAPEPGAAIAPGERYVYSRDVWRGEGPAEAGDRGTEVMAVGGPVTLTLDGWSYRVLDIRFEVTNPKTGYDYRERALMLVEPRITLGAIGASYGPDGEILEGVNDMPESISMPGQAGFRSMNPVPSCHVSS